MWLILISASLWIFFHSVRKHSIRLSSVARIADIQTATPTRTEKTEELLIPWGWVGNGRQAKNRKTAIEGNRWSIFDPGSRYAEDILMHRGKVFRLKVWQKESRRLKPAAISQIPTPWGW